MKTIKSLKDITTLEVCDVVVFGNLEYLVRNRSSKPQKYYLSCRNDRNNKIFNILHLSIPSFCDNLGISILNIDNLSNGSFPEVKSLEALTAIVTALYREYEKQNILPKTWEEFCARNTIKPNECWIGAHSICKHYSVEVSRCPSIDKNICTSEQDAEAHLALMQLCQLRKAYVKNWEPDLTKACFGIVSSMYGINITSLYTVYRNLSFPTYDLAEQFLTNFKDLLEIAKPLL